LRLGAVRYPPRGVAKSAIAERDYYDVWLPELAPSRELVARAQAAESAREWQVFVRAYRREMQAPAARHLMELLAALSTATDLAIGCYCKDEVRCHRSLLRELLREHGAKLNSSRA